MEIKQLVHTLKLKSEYYEDSKKGLKNFEIRKNDRDFKVGDVLKLVEVKTIDGKLVLTGNAHYKKITYILDNPEYLKNGYVCLGLQPIAVQKE